MQVVHTLVLPEIIIDINRTMVYGLNGFQLKD